MYGQWRQLCLHKRLTFVNYSTTTLVVDQSSLLLTQCLQNLPPNICRGGQQGRDLISRNQGKIQVGQRVYAFALKPDRTGQVFTTNSTQIRPWECFQTSRVYFFISKGLNAGTTTQVLEICMKIERGGRERGINLNLKYKEL